MNGQRHLIVTIDTEVDKDVRWRISDPVSFSSVTHGVPEILTPLFQRYGIKPTYLLSPEVIEHQASAAVLRTLLDSGSCELGTHLHEEFIEPRRTRFPDSMAGLNADAIQTNLPPDVEAQKLENVTGLFRQAFGRRPVAFRAGRFALSESTLRILADLGYRVDSSVTPGIRWRSVEGILDYRRHTRAPRWYGSNGHRILELPVSIASTGPLVDLVEAIPGWPARALVKLAGRRARRCWLRPSFSSAEEMIDFVKSTDDALMVVMFHSMEVIPKASPYARSAEEVTNILARLERLFRYCVDAGITSLPLGEAAAHVPG